MEYITFDVVLIVVLILCSAFFSASETALTAVSRAHMYALMQEGVKRALSQLQRAEIVIHVVSVEDTEVPAPPAREPILSLVVTVSTPPFTTTSPESAMALPPARLNRPALTVVTPV